MTENVDAIMRQLKIMEARFGTIGTRLNSIDLRIGNIESCVKSDEPSASVMEVQSESPEPGAKRLKPSRQADADISAESVTSSTTIRSVETPVEDNDPDERNIAMSDSRNMGKAKHFNNDISLSLPTESMWMLLSNEKKGKAPSNSISPFGCIHPAMRQRDRNDFEKETLSVFKSQQFRMLFNASGLMMFGLCRTFLPADEILIFLPLRNANTAIRMYNIVYQSLNPNAALSHLRFIRYNTDVRCPHTARQLWRLHG